MMNNKKFRDSVFVLYYLLSVSLLSNYKQMEI